MMQNPFFYLLQMFSFSMIDCRLIASLQKNIEGTQFVLVSVRNVSRWLLIKFLCFIYGHGIGTVSEHLLTCTCVT